MTDLAVTDGALAGAWIKSSLGGDFGAVTLQVPRGYEGYARIFHPAGSSEGKPVRWAEVAKIFGTTAHREMQWHAILGLADPRELQSVYGAGTPIGSKWSGHDPPIGAMDPETLDALCQVLIGHTADPSHCYFGLCTIQSWLDAFSAHELKPLLNLPLERDYIVLTGSLLAVRQIGRRKPLGPPNLIWPADHAWLVASEVDFDSTLVGGCADLIKAIVDSPDLEAWQVEPTDSLAADADRINRASQ